jgi:hypothetical protein
MLKRIKSLSFTMAVSGAATSSLREIGMTPAAISSGGTSDSQIGSSKLAGVPARETKLSFVRISGYRPTATRYFNPADNPESGEAK